MGCNNFNDVPSFKCESPADRIDRDIKHCSEFLNYDFEKFRDFMWKNHDYVVQAFPRMIGDPKHTMFKAALHTRRGDVYVINPDRGTIRKIKRCDFDYYVIQWHIESDLEAATKERDMWRDRLKSVGVNVNW